MANKKKAIAITTDIESAFDEYGLGLNLIDEHFLDEYYRTKDIAKAYIKASGNVDCTRSNAMQCGKRLIQANHEKYSAYLSLRSKEDQDKHKLSLDQALYGLACIASANYMDFFKKTKGGELVLDLENISFEQQMAIKSIKQKKIYKGDDCFEETLELETYDKHDALRDYIRHHGGFTQKIEITGDVSVSHRLESARKRIQKHLSDTSIDVSPINT